MGVAGQSELASSQDDPEDEEWCFGQPPSVDDKQPTRKQRAPRAKSNKAKTKARRTGDSKAKKAPAKASRKRKAASKNGSEVNAFETPPDGDQSSIERSLGHADCMMTPQQRHSDHASASARTPKRSRTRLRKLQDENKAFSTTPDKNQRSVEHAWGNKSNPTPRERYGEAKAKAKAKSRSAAKAKSRKAAQKTKPKQKARAKAKMKDKQGKSSRPKADKGNSNSKDENSSSSSSSVDSNSTGSDRTLNSKSPGNESGDEPEPQTARAFLQPDEMFGELLDEENPGPADSMSPRAKEVQPDQVNSRQDAFSFVDRHLHRLQSHFGHQCLLNLSQNLGEMAVMSLYSGLGGAEISAGLIHTSMTRMKAKDPNSFPDTFASKAPSMQLACDCNSDCQKVLRSHIDPWL